MGKFELSFVLSILAVMESVDISESKSGISLITKGGRQEPPIKNDAEQQSNVESVDNAQQTILKNSNDQSTENEMVSSSVILNEDEDVNGNQAEKENEEYFEEKDLLNNAFVLEKDAKQKDKLSEQYKQMPSRIYLEKTGVIKAITLALQSATEQRPQDAATFVADFLMKYSAKCKEEEERNKNQACDLSQI